MPGNALHKRLLSVALLTLLLVSILPASSFAQEVSDEVLITSSTERETYSSLAADSQGNFHVLFTVDGETVLYYRKFDPDGLRLAGPSQLAPTGLTGTITGFSIAVDTSDRVHIAFAATENGQDQNDIYYSQLNRDGTVTATARKVDASTNNTIDPDIGVDSSGNAYLSYCEYGDNPYVVWLHVSPSGQGGNKVMYRSSQGLGIGYTVSSARIAVFPNGTSYILWLQRQNSIARLNVWSNVITSTGMTYQGGQLYSNPLSDCSALQAKMGLDNVVRASFIVSNEVRLVQIAQSGTSSLVVAQAPLGGDVRGSDIAITSTNDAYIAYYSRANLLPTTESRARCVIRWDSNDTTSAQLSLEGGTGTGSAMLPSIAAGKGAVGVVYARQDDLWVVFIGAASSSNNPPVARLTTRPAGPQVNQPVTFDGSTSSDHDSGDSVAGYSFTYGDAASSGWVTQPTITHTYTTAGTYIASLRVRDTHGTESSTVEVSVTVTGGTTTNKAPVAALSASPANVAVGDDVLLSGTGSTDADGDVAQYLFSFGDGATLGWTSSSQAVHAYASAGVFTATLQVKDDKGKQSENTASVQVEVEAPNEAPTAHIVSIAPSPALVGDAVTFTGEGTDPDGVISQYLWESNFEPVLSEQSVFTSTTLEVGIHTVSLKVRDDDGVWSEPATALLEIKRNNAPVVESRTNRTSASTETVIDFLVKYTDAEGDYPTSERLYYGRGGEYIFEDLVEADEADKDVKDGKFYFFKTKLDKAGKWTYYFEFQNAKNAKVKSATGTIEVKEAKGFIPGPGAAMAALAMLVALGASAVTVGRGSKSARNRRTG